MTEKHSWDDRPRKEWEKLGINQKQVLSFLWEQPERTWEYGISSDYILDAPSNTKDVMNSVAAYVVTDVPKNGVTGLVVRTGKTKFKWYTIDSGDQKDREIASLREELKITKEKNSDLWDMIRRRDKVLREFRDALSGLDISEV